MSGCSLVAQGLPSLIGTATPTFSYDHDKHYFGLGDDFGIQMTYMSGTSTCYQGTKPTFTPIISNVNIIPPYIRTCSYRTAGAPATYTGIFCDTGDLWNFPNSGALTIDNYMLFDPLGLFVNKPRPFTATFGTSPAPSTVATTTVLVTSTATSTIVGPAIPAATTTVTSASATTTRTTSVTSTFPVTQQITNTISSCTTSIPPSSSSKTPVPSSAPPPSSSSSVAPPPPPPPSSTAPAPPSSSSSISTPIPSPTTSNSATPSPSATGLSCPASNGKRFSTSKGDFIVECFVDRSDSDIGVAGNNPRNFEQCIQACAANSECQDVSYIPDGPCYLKSALGTPNSNGGVWGARIANIPMTSSAPVATTTTASATILAPPTSLSSTSTSATGPSTTGVSCPASNGATLFAGGKQYLVECRADYIGDDLPGGPTYPGSYEGCLADCSSMPNCGAVSYVINGPCYLKSGTGGGKNTNSNIIGGKLVGAGSGSSVRSSSSVVLPSTTQAPGPATVTVTTTISNTGYQCACTPTSVFTPSVSSSSAAAPSPTSKTGPITCPGDNGSTFTTDCGAVYAVECAADRFGNDLDNGLVFVDTYAKCLQACDKTPNCVDVSWVIGNDHSACYMKAGAGAIRENMNIIGGRQISGCVKISLHRKRVAHASVVPGHKLAKRGGFFGPDFTFTQEHLTATQTSTVLATVSSTSTPVSGTATSTAFTLASATITFTTSSASTVFNTVSVTTCPTPAFTG
ncbi:sequence-specific DNA binding RNA polymerase II transcription factor [Stemphylium lycopersici]|uniref:Sequence-specific DNA binding RNA polymerase II transcription factor n=1 Tax=Stemphylium lycopersici TaxID=183478 RepID=A0A364NBE1_STELY|nr:sequence-specific DNA binding RNA polymerase II transcription factor [Stemphylium lycopersici]RAR14625.1 sequence-specific DNA binding RNA polymerase II transcription factor [Stemphylium lycopersici]